jgi:multisubunit Na+/H+ antiporter MnhB subunit
LETLELESPKSEQRTDGHYLHFRAETQNEPGMNVGHWIEIVIGAVVLLVVLAALYPTLTSALTKYAANDTSGFGTILKSIVPILIGVAVLLAFVFAFLPRARAYGKHK